MKLIISLFLALSLVVLEVLQRAVIPVFTGAVQQRRERWVGREDGRPVPSVSDQPVPGVALEGLGRPAGGASAFSPARRLLPVRIVSPGTRASSQYPFTAFTFCLTQHGAVSLQIFTLDGQPRSPNLRWTLNAGWHRVEMDASRLSPGVYVYRLQTETMTFTRKMLVLR